MKHVRAISRRPSHASTTTTTGLDPLELVVIALFYAVFSGWDNFLSVFQNLTKFYEKT